MITGIDNKKFFIILVLPLTLLITALSLVRALPVGTLEARQKPYVAFGIFIGKIEEGARIFSPARLLPFAHPEARGHQFPTALKFHQQEYDALIFLGDQVGLKLEATLQRYPTQPVQDWWYADFEMPPLTEMEKAEIEVRKPKESPIPGLRAVAFKDAFPLCFIVDTRKLSLEERGMKRATTLGLDLSREQFLHGLAEIQSWFPTAGILVVIFQEHGK